MPQLPDMMTAAEAAKALRCTRTTIHTLIKSGELEGVMIGGRWLVFADDVKAKLARKPADES